MPQSLQKNEEVKGLVRDAKNGSLHVLNGGRRKTRRNRNTRRYKQKGGVQGLYETNAKYEADVSNPTDNALFMGMRPAAKSIVGGKRRRNRRNKSTRRRRSRHQRKNMKGGRRNTRKNRNQRRNRRRNTRKNRSNKQKGGMYRQYMSNIAITPSYSVGGTVGVNDTALANPPLITRTDNCVNQYKHV